MIVEVCDLCEGRVCEMKRTEVIIKDYKGVHFDQWGSVWPAKRQFKAVICDKCLDLLKGKAKKE